MSPTKKRRPSGTALDSAVAATPTVHPTTVPNTADTATTRCCRICKRPLFAAKSCRLHIGPKCAHKIAASITLPGWRVETVAADHGTIAVVLVPLVVAP